jgi:hypothetical protein
VTIGRTLSVIDFCIQWEIFVSPDLETIYYDVSLALGNPISLYLELQMMFSCYVSVRVLTKQTIIPAFYGSLISLMLRFLKSKIRLSALKVAIGPGLVIM